MISWNGRPIIREEDKHQLEGHLAKRLEQTDPGSAQNLAYQEYKDRAHSNAAAHHFAHAKAATEKGRRDLADKHMAFYRLHLHAMHENSRHAIPVHVRLQLEGVRVPRERIHFESHPVDAWALKGK